MKHLLNFSINLGMATSWPKPQSSSIWVLFKVAIPPSTHCLFTLVTTLQQVVIKGPHERKALNGNIEV